MSKTLKDDFAAFERAIHGGSSGLGDLFADPSEDTPAARRDRTLAELDRVNPATLAPINLDAAPAHDMMEDDPTWQAVHGVKPGTRVTTAEKLARRRDYEGAINRATDLGLPDSIRGMSIEQAATQMLHEVEAICPALAHHRADLNAVIAEMGPPKDIDNRVGYYQEIVSRVAARINGK